MIDFGEFSVTVKKEVDNILERQREKQTEISTDRFLKECIIESINKHISACKADIELNLLILGDTSSEERSLNEKLLKELNKVEIVLKEHYTPYVYNG